MVALLSVVPPPSNAHISPLRSPRTAVREEVVLRAKLAMQPTDIVDQSYPTTNKYTSTADDPSTGNKELLTTQIDGSMHDTPTANEDIVQNFTDTA